MSMTLRLMRRTLPVFLVLLFTGNAYAEWLLLGRTDAFRMYVEKGSVQKNGTTVQISQLIDFVTAQWIDAQTVIMSAKSVVEFDCSQPRLRTLAVQTYSEQIAGGRMVANEKFPTPEWEPVQSGSSAEGVRKFACSK